jgi:hypothetical protein
MSCCQRWNLLVLFAALSPSRAYNGGFEEAARSTRITLASSPRGLIMDCMGLKTDGHQRASSIIWINLTRICPYLLLFVVAKYVLSAQFPADPSFAVAQHVLCHQNSRGTETRDAHCSRHSKGAQISKKSSGVTARYMRILSRSST